MSEFIVLGLIPGTSVRVSFEVWLIIVGVLGMGIARRGFKAPKLRVGRLVVFWRASHPAISPSSK